MDNTIWVRRCQECGREHSTKKSNFENDNWRQSKCLTCKSEALDYGSMKPLGYKLKKRFE